MANEIEVTILAKLDKIEGQLKGLEGTGRKAGETFGNNFSQSLESAVGKSVSSFRNQILALASLVTSGVLFKKMIENATEAEDAINQLTASMRNAGTLSQDSLNKFLDYSHQLEVTAGVSDDLINKNAALLVSVGNLSGQGLERATKAAVDLAAGLSIDLDSAFSLVAKAASGNVGILARYGIKIDETTPKSERFAAALDLLNQKFGGLAEEKLNTFSGALSKLGISFNNVFEEMGKLIIQSPVIRDLIKFIAGQFEKLAQDIEKLGKSGDAVGDITKKLLELTLTITEIAGPPIELFMNTFVTAFKMIRSALQELLVVPFAQLISGIASVGEKIGVVSKQTANDLRTFSAAAQEVSADFNRASEESASKMFDFDVTLAVSNLVSKMQMVAEASKPARQMIHNEFKESIENTSLTVSEGFNQTLIGMDEAANTFATSASANFRRAGAQMFQSIGTGAGQAFAAFGKAVAKGENALQAFINSLLASMGQMAIMLGTQFILQGIAYTWAGMPNGPSLIAAGAALAAFGGILSAVGGTSSTAGAGGGGGGGGIGGTTGAQDMTSIEEIQQQRPQTNITVQIQGNVLDRRQTGLELAEVIQETFGSQGITYRTA